MNRLAYFWVICGVIQPVNTLKSNLFTHNACIHHSRFESGINTHVCAEYSRKKSHLVINSIMERNYNRRSYQEIDDDSLVLDDFQQILESIYLFQQVYGDLKITNKFEVPAQDPWPSNLHGLRLGKRLEKLFSSTEFMEKHPEKVREFYKLGIEPNISSLVDEWTVIYEAIKIYKELNGNLRISAKFVVPDEDPWPRLTRNMKLGVRVAAIRSAGRYVKEFPERKSLLDELGFEWRIRDNT